MLGSFEEEFGRIERRYRTGADQKKLAELRETLNSRPVVLFGLGFFGLPVYNNLLASGIAVTCFCDSNKRGAEKTTGLPIISPEELMRGYEGANVIISVANPMNQQSVKTSLISRGFDAGRIFGFDTAFRFLKKSVVEVTRLTSDEFEKYLSGYKWSYDFFEEERSKRLILDRICSYFFGDTIVYERDEPAYFPKNLFALSESEIFVDGGLYIGDTAQEFFVQTNNKYSAVYGFDIDENNAKAARESLRGYDNVSIILKGLWDAPGQLCAELDLAAGSQIIEGGGTVIPVTSLDFEFSAAGERAYPTFIKMDIEGSEKNALIGARKIIKTAKPKLAICAYHKPEDIYELPQTILNLRGDYKMALRHYSPYTWDTVLYAY